MFKDLQEGQTHSENDGCGEPEHNKNMTPTNNEWEKEFDKENYFVKDKVDGQEHCLSGDKQFYLIKANEEIKSSIRSILSSERQKIKKVIELAIAEETNIARQENQPTSRLTSLFNKVNKIIDKI